MNITTPRNTQMLQNTNAHLRTKLTISCLLLCFILGGNFIVTHAQENERDSERGKAISGRVISDSNQPLTDATLYLRAIGGEFSQRTARADGEGRFIFPDVDEGVYRIDVSVPAYILQNDEASESEDARYFRAGDNVTLMMMKGGVITGRVTTQTGEPVVGVGVLASRLMDEQGRPVNSETDRFRRERNTDDRGVYRIFGLPAGNYVVSASGGSRYSFPRIAAYDGDARTYHPSSNGDSAAKISVRSNSEIGNIDIIYRGENGRTVSGKLAGAIPENDQRNSISVSLRNAATGIVEHVENITDSNSDTTKPKNTFSFNSVGDGEYFITANAASGVRDNRVAAASPPRRIIVKGADVTGLELALAPLLTINGQLKIAASIPTADARTADANCQSTRINAALPSEFLIVARRNETATKGTSNKFIYEERSSSINAVPDAQGIFRLSNLETGDYRIELPALGENYFVRDVQINRTPNKASTAKVASKSNATTSATTAENLRTEFSVTPTERPSNIVVNVAAGAARIEGKLTRDVAPNTRVLLVPAEAKYAQHAWRYHETSVNNDASWSIANIAPGTYFVVALPASATDNQLRRPRFADAPSRLALRRQAETNGTRIELHSCQRFTDIN